MENLDFVSVPVIVATVVGCLQLLKTAVGGNEKVLKFFPLIAAGLGAILGIIAFFAVPEIIPAGNAFVAVLVGGSSGLAATGTHQVFKQLLPKLSEHLPKLTEQLTEKKEEGEGNDGADKK